MTEPSAFAWGLAQLTAHSPEPPPPRFNPRPPGVIQTGSASDAVMQFLKSRPGRYFSESDLIRQTGRSRASITWALHYLRGQGLIASVNDGRHTRHLQHTLADQDRPWNARFDPSNPSPEELT